MFLTLHIYHFGHGGLNFIESTIFVILSQKVYYMVGVKVAWVNVARDPIEVFK